MPTRRSFGLSAAAVLGAAMVGPGPVGAAPLRPLRLQWRVGDVRITRFADFEANPPTDPRESYPAADVQEIIRTPWLHPGFADERGWLRSCFGAFLVETPARRILVDALAGPRPPGAPPAPSTLPEDLAAAGRPPRSVDLVVNTHLHFDHIGWNTRFVDGRPIPTFPKARYLISRPEFDAARTAGPDWMRAVFARSVQPLADARVLDLVAPDARITPEVSLIPAPGHTAGHVCVRIVSQGREAVIAGDLVHHPIELAHPDWAGDGELDKAMAVRTRWRLLEEFAARRSLVMANHFVAPCAGHVVREGAAFRFDVGPRRRL